VYAVDVTGVLSAVDEVTGTERWEFSGADSEIVGPTVAGDTVYVTDSNGIVRAVDTATGHERWHSAQAYPGAFTYGDGRLYVPTDGAIVALDMAGGKLLWTYTAPAGAGSFHTAATSDGVVYAGSDAGGLVAVDGATGALKWHVDTGPSQMGTAVATDGRVFLGGGDDLTAYDAATGAVNWRVAEPIQSPAISGGIAFSGSRGAGVSAHDETTGKKLWQFNVNGVTRPVGVANGIVYVPADDEHRVYALDAATGRELWHVDLDSGIDGSLALADGTVFVGTGAGGLYAFGAGASVSTAGSPVPSPSSNPAPTSESSGTVPLEGTWTATVTQADAARTGWSNDQCVTQHGQATLTLVIAAGTYTQAESCPGQPSEVGDRGTIIVTPDTFSHLSNGGPARANFDWSLVGDVLQLHFRDASGYTPTDVITDHFYFEHDWTRGTGGSTTSPGVGPSASPATSTASLSPPPASVQVSPEASGTASPTTASPAGNGAPGNPLTLAATLSPATTGLSSPMALAFGPDGNLYVVDLDSTVRVITPNGTQVRSWGSRGSATGQFFFGANDRADIAVGDDGLVYVMDGGNHRVQVFQPDGTFVRHFGSFGTAPGQFMDPINLTVDPSGDVYLIDDAAQTVNKLDAHGTLIWSVGGPHETDPDLQGHHHRGSFDPAGVYWITNDDNGRVVGIDPDGKKVAAYGGLGTELGEFQGTDSVVFDAAGNAYVDECADTRLQVLNPQHDVIGVLDAPDGMPFGYSYTFGPDGRMYAISGSDHCAGGDRAPTGTDAAKVFVFQVALPPQP
jgi:outer membrane protein assembly factor BamB